MLWGCYTSSTFLCSLPSVRTPPPPSVLALSTTPASPVPESSAFTRVSFLTLSYLQPAIIFKSMFMWEVGSKPVFQVFPKVKEEARLAKINTDFCVSANPQTLAGFSCPNHNDGSNLVWFTHVYVNAAAAALVLICSCFLWQIMTFSGNITVLPSKLQRWWQGIKKAFALTSLISSTKWECWSHMMEPSSSRPRQTTQHRLPPPQRVLDPSVRD